MARQAPLALRQRYNKARVVRAVRDRFPEQAAQAGRAVRQAAAVVVAAALRPARVGEAATVDEGKS